jgi:hypothetical protein
VAVVDTHILLLAPLKDTHSKITNVLSAVIQNGDLFPKFARKLSLKEDVVGLAAFACLSCIIGTIFVEAIIITAIVAAIKIPMVVRFIIVTTKKQFPKLNNDVNIPWVFCELLCIIVSPTRAAVEK